MPNQTPSTLDHDTVTEYHPALSVQAITWLSGKCQTAQIPRTLTGEFLRLVDADFPVAVLRTHLEQVPDERGGTVDVLVALCSFAPKQSGPRLLNEVVCKPKQYDDLVGEMTLTREVPRHGTGIGGMIAAERATLPRPSLSAVEEDALASGQVRLPATALQVATRREEHVVLPRGARAERVREAESARGADASRGAKSGKARARKRKRD
ncbi:MAG: hypothetical protein ACR2JV_06105 [Gaiellales bacterium]